MRPKSKQEQYNQMLVFTKIKLATSKWMKKQLLEAQNKVYDPIENAMRDILP